VLCICEPDLCTQGPDTMLMCTNLSNCVAYIPSKKRCGL